MIIFYPLVKNSSNMDTDLNIRLIFEYLKQLEKAKQLELEQQNRKRIGYRLKNER